MRFHRRWLRKPVSTPEALLLKDALEQRGLRIKRELWDGHKHIDLTIPAAKINIEVDGNQHLVSCKQVLADLRRSHGSSVMGYDTIHIHNSEIANELEEIADALAEAAKVRIKENALKRKFTHRFYKH